MPFRYRLQKILDLRIMKKEEQELAVVRARQEVARVENLIDQNNQEITSTRENMRNADFRMYEAYDNSTRTELRYSHDAGWGRDHQTLCRRVHRIRPSAS